MKILTLHSDSLEVEPKTKAIKDAEKIEKRILKFKECLVVFTAVEKKDEGSINETAQKTADEIENVAKQVKCASIVLYPYVHLTSEPAAPDIAKKILDSIESKLKSKKMEVGRAPFGWYKRFTIAVKGHPLAELSREITAQPGSIKAEEEISGALKDEEKVKSEWFILTPNGALIPAEKFDFKGHENLEKFYRYESSKSRIYKSEPPHIKLMKSLGIADYEPGSDPGNLKWLPKGRLMKSLLEQWIADRVVKYGAMEVETPVMYDYDHPALKSYLHRFPARQYIVKSAKKDFFLRFSACFGQFLTAAALTISYKNLPLKMYELTRYSFRLEKAGELVGLKRLRAFTMPDMHTLCRDMEQAKEEFKNQFNLCIKCLKELSLSTEEYEMGLRFTKDFYEKDKDMVNELARMFNRPILVEQWNFRYAYFDPKFEFNFIDNMDKATALSTVQIDHENGERFNILYTDENNKRKNPLILHCSPTGGLERIFYALLERAAMQIKKKQNPVFPLWLSPIQVRLCPINDSFIEYCKKVARDLSSQNIRVDIDDRSESLQKKIRDAETEWVPFIVTIGEKEVKTSKLAVRIRKTGKVEEMSHEKLIETIKSETRGYPFKPLPLPIMVSKQLSF